MDQQVNIPVNVDTSSANDQMNQLLATMNKLVDVTSSGFSGLSSQFDSMGAGIAKLSSSGGMLTKTLGDVKAGFDTLAANPWIGVATIIAALIVKLIQQFSKMEAVGDSLGKATEQLSMIFKVLADKVLTPLIDLFVTLVDWVVKAATFFTSIFSPATAKAAEETGKLAEKMDQLNDSEKEFELRKGESNAKIAEARDLAKDETKTIGERKAALQVAAAEEKKIQEESIQRTKDRAQIKLQTLAMEMHASKEVLDQIKSGDYEQLKSAAKTLDGMKNLKREQLDGVYDELNKTNAARVEAANTERSLRKDEQKLDKEEEAKRKEAENKRKEDGKKAAEDRKKQIENDYNYKKELDKLNNENTILNIKDQNQKEIKLEDDKNKEVLAKFKKDLDDKKLTKKQYNDLVQAETTLHENRSKRIQEESKWKSIKIADDLAETLAKTDADKDAAKRKKIKNDMEYELSKVKEGSMEAELIKAKYKLKGEQLDEEIAKRNEARRKKSLDNTLSEDEFKKSLIEKEVVNTQDKFDRLGAIEQKVHDDKEAQIEFDYVKAIDDAKKKGEDTTEIKRSYNLKVKQNDQELADSKRALAETEQQVELQKYETIGNAAEALTQLLGKETAAGKAMGIANALIATYTGVTRVWEAKDTLPSPFNVIAKVAGTVTALTSGLKAVQQITAVKVPGGGGGGQSTGGMSVSTPSFSAPQVFGIGGSQVIDPSKFKEMQAQKVIVTESDITRVQSRISNIRKASVQGS